jgi:hypothetical protein
MLRLRYAVPKRSTRMDLASPASNQMRSRILRTRVGKLMNKDSKRMNPPSPETPSPTQNDFSVDREWYLAAYPDVAAAGVDPDEHFRAFGKAEGRKPAPSQNEREAGFDRAWYLKTYKDVAAAGIDPFEHWIQHGKAEGRRANPWASFSAGQAATLAKSFRLGRAGSGAIESAPTFESGQYWRERYRSGGNSGAGSYGRLAEFKAEIINDFVLQHKIEKVIEFGCGDGAQLGLANYPDYLGFDIADESVERCRARFAGDATKQFLNVDAWRGERADLVMSLDVIFHLVEDHVFHRYMERLFASAERHVIIYSSNHEAGHDAQHVRHRRFTDWIDTYHADFELVQHIPNRWPLVDDGQNESFADFYIFRRVAKVRHSLPGHLVVSLTSYEPRFPTLELTLRRILQQSIEPDETVLWLTEEDKARLPDGVLALCSAGLTIRVTKDLRSYKKIIPTLQIYPDSFIVTLDDDICYPPDTVEQLLSAYRNPSEILCRRAHKPAYDTDGKLLPYNAWQHQVADETGPDLFFTGCAGTLFPPHTLSPEVLSEAEFMELAPYADDVWLFWMARLAHTPIRRVGSKDELAVWPGSEEQALYLTHNAGGGNDRAIAALAARYGCVIGNGLAYKTT